MWFIINKIMLQCKKKQKIVFFVLLFWGEMHPRHVWVWCEASGHLLWQRRLSLRWYRGISPVLQWRCRSVNTPLSASASAPGSSAASHASASTATRTQPQSKPDQSINTDPSMSLRVTWQKPNQLQSRLHDQWNQWRWRSTYRLRSMLYSTSTHASCLSSDKYCHFLTSI